MSVPALSAHAQCPALPRLEHLGGGPLSRDELRPLGIRITPILYAASSGKTTLIGPGDDVRLGTHTTDGSHVEASFTHAGTTLDWRYGKVSAFDLRGGWTTAKFGEWGLRFWVVLALSQDDGARLALRRDAARSPTAPSDRAAWRSRPSVRRCWSPGIETPRRLARGI